MDPLTSKVVGEMIKSLKKSMWPPATIKGTLLEYEFEFGYSNVFQRALHQGLKALRLQVSPQDYYNIIKFKIIDIAGEDVELLGMQLEEAKRAGVDPMEYVSSSLQYALKSDVIVFLIDAEKVTDDRSDKRYDEMVNYDILMSQLYSFLAGYRIHYLKKQTPLFPVFVLTKFDAMDPNIRKGLGIPPDLQTWIRRFSVDREQRWKFFHEFMRKFYRQSLALIYGAGLKGVKLEDAPIFISFVSTELNEDGIMVPKVVTKEHAIEIDYSETEYIAFIDYFGKIAGKISDKSLSASEVTGYPAV